MPGAGYVTLVAADPGWGDRWAAGGGGIVVRAGICPRRQALRCRDLTVLGDIGWGLEAGGGVGRGLEIRGGSVGDWLCRAELGAGFGGSATQDSELPWDGKKRKKVPWIV